MFPPETHLVPTIKYEIEHIFGRKILTSRDCIELNDEIFAATKECINVNTLRRFFGLIKAPYQTSPATLTILSKYCGFMSTDNIYKVKNTETFEKGISDTNVVLQFFVTMFRDTVVPERAADPFLNMIIHTINFLNGNKFLADKFQKSIAETENGQRFYFEQTVNVDELNSYYGNGLCHYNKFCGTAESKVFASSLYIFKAWLNDDKATLLENIEAIQLNGQCEKMDFMINTRRLAALLYYQEAANIDNEQVRMDIHNAHQDLLSSPDKVRHICGFTIIIAEALLLTGYPGDALYYLEQCKKLHADGSVAIPFDQLHFHMLLQAYALFHLKFFKKAALVLEKVKSSEFPFLTKNFSSILYFSLVSKASSKVKATRYQNQIQGLIEKTGFKRLLTL